MKSKEIIFLLSYLAVLGIRKQTELKLPKKKFSLLLRSFLSVWVLSLFCPANVSIFSVFLLFSPWFLHSWSGCFQDVCFLIVQFSASTLNVGPFSFDNRQSSSYYVRKKKFFFLFTIELSPYRQCSFLVSVQMLNVRKEASSLSKTQFCCALKRK